MATMAFVFGNITYDYYFGRRALGMDLGVKNMHTKVHILSSIILIISGIVNMVILAKESKFVRDMSYKAWKMLLYLKFFLTLALTPLLEKVLIPNSMDKEEICFKIRFYMVLGLFLVSPFVRYFREYYMTKQEQIPNAELKKKKVV